MNRTSPMSLNSAASAQQSNGIGQGNRAIVQRDGGTRAPALLAAA